MIEEYGECNVNTLHKKNLLHLGEDRYLTTLMLKNFPKMKTSFTPDAYCLTTAPESWKVLLSQRRRWINSTVHNLVELLNVSELCGFCLFSMRFVVFIDLLATLVQPAIMVYIGYLVYLVVNSIKYNEPNQFPLISLILLGAMYGFQAIVFLIKREWQHIGWMIIYLISIPIFSFFIPLYSFWHMDDFSWGNTRVVVGEKGKKQFVSADGESFDLSSIPHRRWEDYEQDLKKIELALKTSMPDRTSKRFSIQSTAAHPGVITSPHLNSPENSPSSRFRSSTYSEPREGSRNSLIVESKRLSHSQKRLSANLSMISNTFTNVLPSDEEIREEIIQILSRSDLMTITKKQIREELSEFFRVDLELQRNFINRTIDEILAQYHN
ncbi:Chitin synthase, class 6 [Coelomomyces lativittatus]|nr:Chitin synthase, class 6 [Coelomomyces lativittatus]